MPTRTTRPAHTSRPARTSPTDDAQHPSARGRLRTAWKSAHTPVPGIPTWARRAALAVPLAVLPSSLWRILQVDGGPDRGSGSLPAWLPVEIYVILLSLVSELLAFTAVGLIAAWGEVWPRWVPVLRGRRIPPPAVVVPAALGAVALTVLWTAAAVTDIANVTLRGDVTSPDYPGETGGWTAVVFYLCYAPLLLWGPLLGAVTVAYLRRRRTEPHTQAAAPPG